MESAAATHRRRWSQAEKDMCAAGVKKYGAFNHRRIAQLVGTRSKAQVRTYLYAAGYRKLGAGYTTVAAAAREAADLAGSEAPVTAPAATEPATARSRPDEEAPSEATDDRSRRLGNRAADEGDPRPVLERRRARRGRLDAAAAKGFDRAFARQLAARFEATEITSVNVVHGHGTVARRLLLRGEVFVDPCASYIEGAPPASDDRAVAYNDAHFRLRTDTRAAPSYYLNEARDREPNVEWRVIDLGRPALGVVVSRRPPRSARVLRGAGLTCPRLVLPAREERPPFGIVGPVALRAQGVDFFELSLLRPRLRVAIGIFFQRGPGGAVATI